MKKITCFINSLTSGGAERQILHLCDFLQERNYDVTLVTFGDVPDMHNVPKGVKRVNIAPNRNKFIKLLSIFIYFIKVKSSCIISFGQRENLLCLIPLCFRPSIKVIAGERNLTIGTPDLCEKILVNLLYKRANYIVANSASQKKHLDNLSPKLSIKTKTIINYTNLKRFSYQVPLYNKKRRIAIYSRYDKQKNYERVCEAINLLKQRLGTSFIVCWYGNKWKMNHINDDYLVMEELVKYYNISDVMELHDHVINVEENMQLFDVIALLSLHEGFSNSIAEAICCGKPMVVSDISDNSVMVHDNINGYLCNPLDVKSIVDAFIKILTLDDDKIREMSLASRNIAESLFHKDEFINKYCNLIEY